MNLFLLVVLVVACAAQEVENDEPKNDIEDADTQNDEAEKDMQAAVAEDRHGGSHDVGYGYVKVKAVDPSLWSKVFKDYCNGNSQSPINLEGAGATAITCTPFKLKHYNAKPEKMTIMNNGHTAVVTLKMDDMPTVKGGCLQHTYTFEQMHWHWGRTNTKGSEHRIDKTKYPLELHLVHYNSDDYPDFASAVASGDDDALAVLGVMVMINNKGGKRYPYKKIASLLNKIRKPNKSAKTGKTIALKDFLPKEKKFFRYMGSLTTPNCNEIVRWTVFMEPTTIKKKHLVSFRQLYDSYGNKLVNNFRPPQKLKGRMVQKG